MNKMLRLLIVVALVAGIAIFAGQNSAWASSPSPVSAPAKAVSKIEAVKFILGSVKPPDSKATLTKPGPFELGGCTTGSVEFFPENSKLEAEISSYWHGLPELPEQDGNFYRCIARFEYYKNENLVSSLPVPTVNTTICFAVPPQSTGWIYYIDRILANNTRWVAVAGPFKPGIACGPADQTGYYGMVVKKK